HGRPLLALGIRQCRRIYPHWHGARHHPRRVYQRSHYPRPVRNHHCGAPVGRQHSVL
ncbi:hypothetical protein GGI18_003283, partial [Coemansia linderi]